MKLIFTFLMTCSLAWSVDCQLMVRVTSLPNSTPPESKVHVAGNFNNWKADDPNYQLKENPDGTKSISLYPPTGKVEYKFTRGSWEAVEGSENGAYAPNRTYNYDGTPAVVDVSITSWEDLDGTQDFNTAAPNVHILDYHFSIPQLDRERKIWIYLPPDYETSQKRYPVIYMHDGQNLFDAASSFAGEWQVDETLNRLFHEGDFGAIVVGIENGGWRRLDEFSPWYNADLEAGGEGAKYVDFIVNTLKPYVDATYRTLSEQKYTGLMGSSMGGLITHYAGMQHQTVFGKIGVFSPSFWFSASSFTHTSSIQNSQDLRYYTVGGRGEGAEMVNDMNKMYQFLLNTGLASTSVKKVIHPTGQHTEAFWASQFEDAYKWLFGDLTLSNAGNLAASAVKEITVKPNPAFSQLWIENLGSLEGAELHVTSLDGKFVRKFSLNGSGPVDIQNVNNGMHIVNIVLQNRVIFSDKIIVSRG